LQNKLGNRNTSIVSTASSTDSTTSPSTTTAADTGAASRRSSDSSTSGSGSAKRVLKLGPVHWGEHTDDHKDDFYNVDEK
jgi:hypothetical protein